MENTTVLHNTTHFKKRLFQEPREITLHKNNFNREDAYPLSQAWKTTLIKEQNKGKKIRVYFPNKNYSTVPEGKTDPKKSGTGQDLGISKGIYPGRTRE